MSPPLIVFDLDGTLIDTAPDLIDTLNVVFAREGLPPVPFDAARTLIGGGVKRMIEQGLAAEQRTGTPEQIDRLFRDFLDHYEAHIADRSRPFPGLVEALDRLAERGSRFAVCTNKLEGLSLRLLRALDLADRFDAICGQDTFAIQKPDPEILLRTIARAGGAVERSVMVGDSETDILTARAARIPVVAVDFGYTEVPVTQLGPDRVISHFNDLPTSVRELVAERQAN